MSTTISNSVTMGVTLGTSGAYTSPLTITDTGSINNEGTGAGIYATAASTILNAGSISLPAMKRSTDSMREPTESIS